MHEGEDSQIPSVPVVGIGASAGGLEAVTELVKHLSPSTGLALVLVQHLDPNHTSVLAELIARHTSMPVAQATHGVQVQPNHIYVIPPNVQMSVRQGVLSLSPRPEGRTSRLPVDHFLCSLAEDQKERAIGIILSGTASDGTAGLQAIKAEGGITFAQDQSARFDGMPTNAVSSGAVDFILAPREIAQKLAIIARDSPSRLAAANAVFADEPAVREIFSRLRNATRVDLVHYKPSTIQRRLSRRLALNNIDTLEAYLAFLDEKPGELQALFDDLLINVTEFFRDPKTFQVLTEQAFPAMVNDGKGREALRVWVPGCASGEEVYSIAIGLTEFLEDRNSSLGIQIFGTDISDRSIESARAAKYPIGIEGSVSPARLKRFFLKLESGYQVVRSIRDLCVFSRQDVTKDPPLARMDLISCRNLLIYFGPVLQRRVMAIFNYALKPNGFLLLGSSEALGPLADHFISVDRVHKLFKRNLQLASPGFELPGRDTALTIHSTPLPTPLEDAATVLDRKADRMLLTEYAPSGFLVNADYTVVKFRGVVGPYLAPPSGDATLDVLKLVREELAFALRVALDEAQAGKRTVRREHLRFSGESRPGGVHLIVRPIGDSGIDPHFLVLFEEPPTAQNPPLPDQTNWPRSNQPDLDRANHELADELQYTRSHMQSLVEELRSSNEEAQSTNEELQSTNEELQTAKEELQSVNEELTTINEEMRGRNAELSELNSDLINLLSSMQVPIVMLSNQLRIRRYTPAAEKVLNLISTDVGRPLSDLKPRIDVPDLENLLRQVIESMEALEREVQDHAGRWYSLRIQPYRAAGNRIEGAVLQLLDIDPLKRTLEAVKYSRDYAEAILATVREPLLVLGRDLRIQTANRSFLQTFRVKPEETINAVIYEIGQGQWDFPKVRAMLDGVLRDRQGAVEDIEIEHEFQGVGWRTFQLNARRVDREEKDGLILLALEDIGDRKKAAEAKYRRLFETAKDGIVLLDAETGTITDVNPLVLECFGYSRQELVGVEYWSAGPFLEMDKDRTALPRLQAGEVVRFGEVPLQAKDGRTVAAEIVCNMYLEAEKRVIQFNIRDITERKRFDQQLRETAKLESLGLMAGVLAHDFNNLLTGIMGNASLALSEAPPGDLYRNALKEVVQASHRAADLTRQMLAYAGKGRFVVRPLDLSDLVQDIGSLIRTSIPRSVELQFNLADSLPPIEADATQVQQVIMNLVINGAEAIPAEKRGFVRVTSTMATLDAEDLRRSFGTAELLPGNYVSLEVTDTGSGMDAATQARIFDPFFTTKFTGRGLGLAAVQGIIVGHHGAIRVYSAVGHGTTFKVLFPASERARVSPRSGAAPTDLRGTGLVLVVDDEEMILRMAAPALQRHGYEVLTANNGATALEVIRQQGDEIDLVVLDLSMPEMGGEEAFVKIRELHPELPILLSSGYDQSQTLGKFDDLNIAGFVQKPYTVKKIAETVKTALTSKRAPPS